VSERRSSEGGTAKVTDSVELSAFRDNAMTTRTFTHGTAAIELHLGDCFQGMDLMEPECVDVVVTSPPYNLGIGYGVYNDSIDRAEYLDWLEQWAIRVKRVLSPGGSLFLNIAGKPSDPWGPIEAALRLRSHLVLQNTIHWVKSIAVDRTEDGDGLDETTQINLGHIKPINSRRYLSDAHEHIFHFSKSGEVELDRLAIGVPYKDKSNITRWKSAGKDLRCRGNVWFIPYKTIVSRDKERPHPASFPPRLPEMCVKVHGLNRVRLVMDPFMGLGNTAVACADLGVSFIGYEIDPEYYANACERANVRIPTAEPELIPGDTPDEQRQNELFAGIPPLVKHAPRHQ